MRTLSERQCYVNRETEMENMMNERNAKDTIDKEKGEKKNNHLVESKCAQSKNKRLEK